MFFRTSGLLFLLTYVSQCTLSLAQEDKPAGEKSAEAPKFIKPPRYDEEKRNEFIRHVVEEGVKPPIFGSNSYDPIRQVFDPPKKGKPGGGDGFGAGAAGGQGAGGDGGGGGGGGGDGDSQTKPTKSVTGDDIETTTKERKKFASAETETTTKKIVYQPAEASASTREDQTPAWWSKLKRIGPKSGGDGAPDAQQNPVGILK